MEMLKEDNGHRPSTDDRRPSFSRKFSQKVSLFKVFVNKPTATCFKESKYHPNTFCPWAKIPYVLSRYNAPRENAVKRVSMSRALLKVDTVLM